FKDAVRNHEFIIIVSIGRVFASSDTTVRGLTRTRLLPAHEPRKCERKRRSCPSLRERTREEGLHLLHTRRPRSADRAFRIEPSPYINSLPWIVPAPQSSPCAGHYLDGNGSR